MQLKNTKNYLTQNISSMYEFIDRTNISQSKIEAYQGQLNDIFNNIYAKSDATTDYLKVLHPFDIDGLINHLSPTATKIRENFDDLIIVAMGGATLNPQTIISVRRHNRGPRIQFALTTDPFKFRTILESVDLHKTAILVSSNSGGTTETIAMFSAFLHAYQEVGVPNIHNHFFFVVGEGDNPIRNMATELGGTIHSHDMGIGGRYSGFSAVGVLPGLVAGLNMHEFLGGANSVSANFWQERNEAAPIRGALALCLAQKPICISLAYSDAFNPYLEWYSQIISESTGKNGLGITPIRGVGPMDQHSMMQLYLDGPQDKIYTFFKIQNHTKELSNIKLAKQTQPSYLQANTLQEINDAEYSASVHAVAHNKNPLREIILKNYDEKCLGALMMHSAIEVVTLCYLMKVNPFDQPGVELIKVKAREILSNK
ncbi:MAG: hypothetical protein ACHP6I_00115 [Rickettsiales bacterium]